jgi:hypothetical protein
LLNRTGWRDRGDQLSKGLLEVLAAFHRQQRRRSEQAVSLLNGGGGGIFLTTDFFGRGTTLLHASEPANKAHQVASIRQSPSSRFGLIGRVEIQAARRIFRISESSRL